MSGMFVLALFNFNWLPETVYVPLPLSVFFESLMLFENE